MIQFTSSRVREILRPMEGDDEDDAHQQDGQPVDGVLVLLAGNVAGDEREEAVAGAGCPASGQEGEVEQEHRQDRADEEAGRYPAEAERGNLARRQDIATDLHVVERLQKDRHQRHEPDPDPTAGPDRERRQDPLAASDRQPQRDQARADDQRDRLLEPDPGSVEDVLRRGNVVHVQRGPTDTERVRLGRRARLGGASRSSGRRFHDNPSTPKSRPVAIDGPGCRAAGHHCPAACCRGSAWVCRAGRRSAPRKSRAASSRERRKLVACSCAATPAGWWAGRGRASLSGTRAWTH
jgi:hypothetical protein